MNIGDIEILTRLLTDADSTQLSAAQLLILENKYYEEVVGKIISETAGGQTQFGDTNYAGFPTFTADLVNSQADYDLSTFATATGSTPLTIMGVEVLDNSGDFKVVRRTTLQKIRDRGEAQSEFFETDGIPELFEIRDGSIVFYPAPDNGISVTLTAGMKVFYLRTADIFTSAQVSTGTKVPGFPSPWHFLLSYGPAHDYGLARGLPQAREYKRTYDEGLRELLDFISRSDQDVRYKFTPKRRRYT